MTKMYTGRQIVLDTFTASGIEYIFGNPGTTELPLIEALPDYPNIRYIMALQEAIAVSMADAYAQLSGKVGVANLHVGPGLGNGIGSLYNAWEGQSPLLVTAGQQDTRYRLREPVLWHDLVAMAKPVTKWSVQAESADELPDVIHRAIKIALDPPTGPVFVALPLNVMIQETHHAPIPPSNIYRRASPDTEGVAHAAELVLGAKRPLIFCGDKVARAGAVDDLVALAERTGASVHGEILPAHLGFPNQHPCFSTRGAGDYAQIRSLTGDADLIMLIGGEFFEEVWYVDAQPFPDGAKVIQLDSGARNLGRNHRLDCGLLGDTKLSLQALNAALDERADGSFRNAAAARMEALQARKAKEQASHQARVERTQGNQPMSTAKLMDEIYKALPVGTALAREAITADNDINRTFEFTAGDYLGSRGGGIGQGMPTALGMKLAYPDRPVLCLTGDGSSLYTIQTLWSAAHHKIPVVIVILNNQVYRVLKYNMNRYRAEASITDREGYPHLDLTDPAMDFVALAKGFGLQAERVMDPADVGSAITRAFASGEPYLLDIVVDGKI
ncbi:MAG: thiamine pyrophosphate-binding protein [Chromatiales bacterium]|nr:thiamine pyrophosphate-binding protein [Chromatiales bacterium]